MNTVTGLLSTQHTAISLHVLKLVLNHVDVANTNSPLIIKHLIDQCGSINKEKIVLCQKKEYELNQQTSGTPDETSQKRTHIYNIP